MKFTHNNLENIIKKFLDKGISSSEINKSIYNNNHSKWMIQLMKQCQNI